MTRRSRDRQRGTVMVVFAITLVILLGFVALAVDSGHIYRVRSELQNASDSAAHAGAQSLDRTAAGIVAARAAAKAYARLHAADRADVELGDEDIEFGYWDEALRTFTSYGSDPENPAAVNAVRVHDHRGAPSGDPVILDFAQLLGVPEAAVQTDAIAVAGGPRSECSFPMVVADCAITGDIADGVCEQCMTYQDNNTDTAGWTSFDTGSVGGPRISELIRAACFDSAGNVAIDPSTGECTGACNLTEVGAEIKVQNGNLMSSGNNNLCTVIQTILRRGVPGGPAIPFTVRAPVLASTPGSTCDASQFSSFHTIAGYATFELYGARCGNNDPGVFASSSPCVAPTSGKYIVGALRCGLESTTDVVGGGYFGLEARHIRIVE